MSIEKGDIVLCRVTGITDFGAFVELEDGETGLIHISEVANTYVKDIRNFLKEDEEIKVKVISIDEDEKIGLSINQLENQGNRIDHASEWTFEEKMESFLEQSRERQKDLELRKEKKYQE